MTPDQQEALSRKYSNDIFMVLPLVSGKLAVFAADRQLIDIVESWQEVYTTYQLTPRPKPRAPIRTAAAIMSGTTLEELGL